jgi:hypothetical protein
MSKNGYKGTATWLFGFLTLLAVLNVFNALIQLNLNGNASIAYFRIFNISFGGLNTEAYFWVSFIITFLLFGLTSFLVYRGLPADPRMLQRITKIEENLAVNSNMIENTQIGFFRRLEENEKANEEVFRKVNINLGDMKKETLDNLTLQKKALENMEEESRSNAETIDKQTTELANLRKKIDKIKTETKIQKPKVTSRTRLDKVKSISPRLANKLSQMKTTNVSELLAADPATIAEKAAELVETIANVQAQAQLLMVPSINEKDAELLVKFGITSRRELANQDPVQLYRGIAGIAKTQVEHGKLSPRKVPTVEDVSSWIKQARL